MKVKLKCGDSITIPKGCKAIVKGKSVVFEKEEKEKVQEFKDGDIVILCGRTIKDRHPFIFEREDDGGKKKFYIGIDFANVLRTFCDDEYYGTRRLHHATEEEKQTLFDKMKEQGLRWNAEKKRVETIRWRAEDGKVYYYVGNQGIIMADNEDGVCVDENRYKFSNYFRTSEQVEEAAKRIKEVLRKYHEEIGE